MCDGDLSEEKALQICADHMEGDWKRLPLSSFGMKKLPGGFSNRLYLCLNRVSDDKLLIRLYAGKLVTAESRLRGGGYETEVLAFHAMAGAGVGPKLHGVFNGGRLEQFVKNSDFLTLDHGNDGDLMALFARKLARLHATEMPLSRVPKDFVAMMQETVFGTDWETFVTMARLRCQQLDRPEMREALALVSDVDQIREAVEWFKSTKAKVNGKITLCHGDLNPANCLVVSGAKEPDDRLVLLDFEFTCYSYRGIDIGTQFHYRGWDFRKLYAGQVVQVAHPGEDVRRAFVKEYLTELRKGPSYEEDERDNEDHVLVEAEFHGSVYALVVALEVFVRDCATTAPLYAAMPFDSLLVVARSVRILLEGRQRAAELLARVSEK